MRLNPKRLRLNPEHIKSHKLHIMRFHAALYTVYLGLGFLEHFGLNIVCCTYGLLGGCTIVCHIVVEEI